MLIVFLLVFSLGYSMGENGAIRHHGFDDFIQGVPGNSGANLYVSRRGLVQVINQWDLNRDGYVDIVISNSHDMFEVVDAFIYWGGPDGPRSLLPELWKQRPLAQVVFDLMDHKANLTRLKAFGGGRSTIADLNLDGYPDLVFCNYIHNYPGLRTAYVYWGSAEGYGSARRTELPTKWAGGVATADLNGDGYPELVFANQGVEAGAEEISPEVGLESYIYWGSPTGFNSEHPGLVPTRGARDVAAADINGDGNLDLAFINNSPYAQELQIFWGGDGRYTQQRMEAQLVNDPTSVRSEDLDRDGYFDLVVTTSGKPETTSRDVHWEGENVAYLFFGASSSLDSKRTVQLPTHEASDSASGDFNGDGHLDIAIANASDGTSSRVPSFIYWGSDQGFSPRRRSELPTLGASGVSWGHLNGDDYVDLVFANSNDGETYDVPSYIYWGSALGFAPYLRVDLQSFGAASVNVSDLNGDGHREILLVNRQSGKYGGKVPNTIYWGNPHYHYSSTSMTALPGENAYDTTVADLNDDDFNDLVLTSSNVDHSYLYWGSREGFSPDRRDVLPAGYAHGSNAADLNRDGHLDLIFTHGRPKKLGTILWGSAQGFSGERKFALNLKSKRTTSNLVADLNRDGYLDLIFPGSWFAINQIFWGRSDGYSQTDNWTKVLPLAGTLELADLNRDGYLDFVVSGGFDPKTRTRTSRTPILWGTPEGIPSTDRMIELEAYSANECAIADLNRDGYLDLVLPNYMSNSTRSLPLFIYWGSKGGGYSNFDRTDLPAESSSGVQTVDLNRDGYPEIVVHNHLKDGDHTINSYIYWNGPEGFDRHRRTELPSFGPHYSQMTDVGNLYTRKLEEEYVSVPIALPAEKRPHRLLWEGAEPHGSKLKFQVRSAATSDQLNQVNWRGPEGESSFYEASGHQLEGMESQAGWIQYRSVFTSPDGGVWPVLSAVEIELR